MVALRMAIAAIVPVILAVTFYLLKKKTRYGKIERKYRQIIVGVVYGIVACLATQFGIPYDGYMLNVRSAAPLTAGLVFGGWAGIIAGVIGAAYRALSILWGVPKYTVVACSVATLLAGIISTWFRKVLFDEKRPSCIYGAFIAAITEVFHMLLVFITHMNDIYTAFNIVKETAIPMIVANALSLFTSLLIISILSKEQFIEKREDRPITKTFSFLMLVSVVICFFITSIFTYYIQDNVSISEVNQTLSLNVIDVEKDVNESVDDELTDKTIEIADKMKSNINSTVNHERYVPHSKVLESYCNAPYNLSEIIYVSKDGTVKASYYSQSLGNRYDIDYDINNDDVLKSFNCLFAENAPEYYILDYQPTSIDPTSSMKYAGVILSNGCLMITGYNETRYNEVYLDALSNVATNRHIGQNGYMFVLSSADSSIVSAPKNSVTAENAVAFIQSLDNAPNNTVLTYDVPGGEEYYFMIDTIKDYIVVACMPVSEAIFSRDMSIYIGLFLQSFVFFILFILIFILLKKLIIDNFHKVNTSLAKITEGDLDTKVNIYDNEEFSSLSNDINATVDRLKEYIDDAEKRIDMELQIAKSIQLSVLPSVFPPYPNRNEFDIFAQMETAKEVGGDFYDFYLIDNDHLAILIADVSGKGIPAAMFMMNAKSIIKSLAESGLSINEILTKANEKLCASNDAGMFVTVWMGILDIQTGVVKYVNAGHNPPLIRHNNGDFEYIKSRHGFVLAGMDGVNYRENELTLSKGDELFLYTDGVTEATNSNNELYSEERLKNVLNANKDKDVTSICKTIKDDIDSFVGDADQFDDITMLALKFYKDDKNVKELNIEATIQNIGTVTEFVDAELEKINCPTKALNQINIAIDELFGNIARYAYNPDKGDATVKVEVTDNPISVIITFIDAGVPFDPLSRDNPDITLSADDREIGGLGIFMVKKTMDDIAYEYKDGKNILTIVKNLGGEKC